MSTVPAMARGFVATVLLRWTSTLPAAYPARGGCGRTGGGAYR